MSIKAKRRPKTEIEQDEEQLSRFISEKPGSTVEDVAARLNWTSSRTSKTLGRLEKKGLIAMRIYLVSQPTPQQLPSTPEITGTIRQMRIQFNRLEKFKNRLQLRDKEIFEKCVNAQMARDSVSASMYANQCAEIRRLIRLVSNMQRVVGSFGSHPLGTS
jgi:division protein CdvB (Snf7/Vps24/ESCRT-III family)